MAAVSTPDNPPRPGSRRPDPVPWPATAAGLVAMLALYLSGRSGPALPVLAAALVLNYLIPVRIPLRSLLAWCIRLALYGGILGANSARFTGVGWILDPDAMQVLGELAAAELVFEYWQESLVPEGPALETLI